MEMYIDISIHHKKHFNVKLSTVIDQSSETCKNMHRNCTATYHCYLLHSICYFLLLRLPNLVSVWLKIKKGQLSCLI